MKIKFLILISLISLNLNAQDIENTNIENNDVILVQEDNVIEKLIKDEEEGVIIEYEDYIDELKISLQSKNLEVIQEILNSDNETDININLYEGNKAIHIAANHLDINYYNFLINNNADINLVNKKEENIFLIGSKNKDLSFIKHLEATLSPTIFKSLVNKKDIYQRTGLHNYINNNELFDSENIDYFIKIGLSINEQDIEGKTVLNYAIKQNNWDTLAYLLKNNGSLIVKDKEGITVEEHIMNEINILEVHKVYSYLSDKNKNIVQDKLYKAGFVKVED